MGRPRSCKHARRGKRDGHWRRRRDKDLYLTMPSGSVLVVTPRLRHERGTLASWARSVRSPERAPGFRWEYHSCLGTCLFSSLNYPTEGEACDAALRSRPIEESFEAARVALMRRKTLRKARRRGRRLCQIAMRRQRALTQAAQVRNALDDNDNLALAVALGLWTEPSITRRRRNAPSD